MKKILYIALMMILHMIIAFMLYLAILTILVRHHIIPLREVLAFTDITMSPISYGLVALIACMIGYRMAKKWWQIIYVDGVYYFDKTKKRDITRRTVRKTKGE